MVVISSPPCTGFGHWSCLGRYIHPGIWPKTRIIDERLAEFAALVRMLQLQTDRHFIVDNFARSELFHLSCFAAIYNIGKCVKVNVPQCALGLVVDGEPICKTTTLMVSSALLADPFRGLECTCRAHGAPEGKTGGIVDTKFAQVWPRAMCQRTCIGIQTLIRQRRKS